MTENDISPHGGEILIYQSKSGTTRLEVRLVDETVWLTQKMLSELFQVGVNTINYHIKEVYEQGELQPGANVRNFRIVQKEGEREITRAVSVAWTKSRAGQGTPFWVDCVGNFNRMGRDRG